MYLSHPVRRMREDPIEGADVRLVVAATDEGKVPALESELSEVGESVERLPYGSLEVTVAEADVSAVCDLDGIESIETADTVGIGGDAGEDI
jgi:hypothetical protein